MKKNVASQSIGGELITASDGSAFTGTVTVYVTGDAGTQAIGSVGSGICTHEGNGYHTYAPAQAETNYDQIAFTFIGTGAIPATVQVFTSFPQTVDNATGIADIPTVSEFNARTLAAADYFDPAADTVANVTLVATTTTNTDMRGTDSAALASVATEARLAELDAANLPAAVDSRMAEASINTTAGAIDNVTLVATTTTNTDMRGTDGANTTVPDAAGTAQTIIGTGGVSLTDLGGMSTGMKAEVNAEVVDTLNVDTYAEPGQGAPAATTSLIAKINYLYKAWRNKTEQTATTLSLYDDAGTTVDQKSTVSDDGTTFTKGEQSTGP